MTLSQGKVQVKKSFYVNASTIQNKKLFLVGVASPTDPYHVQIWKNTNNISSLYNTKLNLQYWSVTAAALSKYECTDWTTVACWIKIKIS